MAHLLFVAHDPGAARCLWAMVDPARARGDTVSFLGQGPALDIWRAEGASVWETFEQCIVADTHFDLAVTGTGFDDFERNLWPQLKARHTPVLAVVEGWTNFTLRFMASGRDDIGDDVLVDGIAVVDDKSRDRLTGKPWCRVPVYVTGQPHLQAISKRLRQRREAARTSAPSKARAVIFFSEPIDRDYGRQRRGYDQFDIVTALADALENRVDVTLKIKPHPRETIDEWAAWLNGRGGNIALASEPSEEMLSTCDGVIGMTSMVLIEAQLSGILALSLQMGRVGEDNALIDRIMPVVVEPGELDAALNDFLAGLDGGADHEDNAELRSIIEYASGRFLEAIDHSLGCWKDKF